MSKWQPIETCPENTWVLIWRSWEDFPGMKVERFQWRTYSDWETVSESSGESGVRRQIREEKILREMEWEDGATGTDGFWMPLPEPPK